MATSTDFLAIEHESKGITYITREESFRAWEHMSKYDVDRAVVTRTLEYDEGEIVPCSLLEEVVARRPRTQNLATSSPATSKPDASARPKTPAELKPWLDVKIRTCIAAVMKMSDIDEIDSRVPLADFGVDFLRDAGTTTMGSVGVGGTIRFMAPELFTSDERPSFSSDVYAFGCLYLQVSGPSPAIQIRSKHIPDLYRTSPLSRNG